MSDKLKTLEANRIAAMKAGDRTKKDVLALLIGRVKLIAKNDGNREPTDRDVIQAVEKTVKEAKETRSFVVQRGDDTSAQDAEIEIVSAYLPKQFTEAELTETIKALITTGPEGKAARGHVMKNLNTDHKGSFDPAMANTILGALLG